MRLIPAQPGRIADGRLIFADRGDLPLKSEAAMRAIRGVDTAVSFEEPTTALEVTVRAARR